MCVRLAAGDPGFDRGRPQLVDHRGIIVDARLAREAGEEVVPLGNELPHRSAAAGQAVVLADEERSEEHTSELQSLMRISYAVFCLKKKKKTKNKTKPQRIHNIHNNMKQD